MARNYSCVKAANYVTFCMHVKLVVQSDLQDLKNISCDLDLYCFNISIIIVKDCVARGTHWSGGLVVVVAEFDAAQPSPGKHHSEHCHSCLTQCSSIVHCRGH